MIINHNLPAMNAWRNLTQTNYYRTNLTEKLISGLRINRAADDAAGLAISETMRSQIYGLNQSSRNAQDAISLIQTAEGALIETHAMLQQMRTLAVSAANGTYTSRDGMEIQKEVDQLKDEINRIADTTHFNHKMLLDGTTSAIYSTDRESTKVFLRGGLRTADQYGTKQSGEGNYKLQIVANPGATQIQKSNILKINHGGDSVQQLDLHVDSGIQHLAAANLQHGNYTVKTAANNPAPAPIPGTIINSQNYLQTKDSTATAINVFGSGGVSLAAVANDYNISMVAEITNIAGDNITYKIDYHSYQLDGTLLSGTTNATVNLLAGNAAFTIGGDTLDIAVSVGGQSNAKLTVGDKSTFMINADVAAEYETIQLQADLDGGATATTNLGTWSFNNDAVNNKTTALKYYTIYEKTGEALSGTTYDGSISFTFGGLATPAPSGIAATFNFEDSLGKPASLDTKLRDIDKFWDNNGRFLLDDAQPVTLIQGNGKQTSFQLFGTDTIQDVLNKFNAAIAENLGQKEYVSMADLDHFVSFVTNANNTGPETLEGTILVRSALSGKDGEIKIIGGEPLRYALGFTEIQSSSESAFMVDIMDAHTNQVLHDNVKITNNMLIGAIHPNVDVKFDSNANITVNYNTATQKFDLTGDANHPYQTFIHLKDNSLVFQIGANEGQDMAAAIGGLNTESLGVHRVAVTDQVSAGRAITIIDRAIDIVSSQRSSLGAIQNRLEHTINNLGVSYENLTSAESRIRDTDMSAVMTELAKVNILSQTATSLLAQANQAPQMVLQLLK